MKLPDAFQVALQVETKSVSVRDDAGPGDFQTGGQFGDLLLHLLAFREAFGDGDPTDHAVPGSNHPTVSPFPGKVSANEPIARREYELIAEYTCSASSAGVRKRRVGFCLVRAISLVFALAL